MAEKFGKKILEHPLLHSVADSCASRPLADLVELEELNLMCLGRKKTIFQSVFEVLESFEGEGGSLEAEKGALSKIQELVIKAVENAVRIGTLKLIQTEEEKQEERLMRIWAQMAGDDETSPMNPLTEMEGIDEPYLTNLPEHTTQNKKDEYVVGNTPWMNISGYSISPDGDESSENGKEKMVKALNTILQVLPKRIADIERALLQEFNFD